MTDPELVTALTAGLAAILGACAAVLVAAAQIRKVGAEVRQLGTVTHATNRRITQETSTNHGSSLRDAVDRIEGAQRGMGRDVGRLAEADHIHNQWAIQEVGRVYNEIERLKTTLTTIQQQQQQQQQQEEEK